MLLGRLDARMAEMLAEPDKSPCRPEAPRPRTGGEDRESGSAPQGFPSRRVRPNADDGETHASPPDDGNISSPSRGRPAINLRAASDSEITRRLLPLPITSSVLACALNPAHLALTSSSWRHPVRRAPTIRLRMAGVASASTALIDASSGRTIGSRRSRSSRRTSRLGLPSRHSFAAAKSRTREMAVRSRLIVDGETPDLPTRLHNVAKHFAGNGADGQPDKMRLALC